MTIEELINNLGVVRDRIEGVSGGYPYTEEEELMLVSLYEAIERLKKDIPAVAKKRMIDSDGYWAEWSCPVCGEIVREGGNCKCGQVLIWD